MGQREALRCTANAEGLAGRKYFSHIFVDDGCLMELFDPYYAVDPQRVLRVHAKLPTVSVRIYCCTGQP